MTDTAPVREPLPQSFVDAFPTRPVVVHPGRLPVGLVVWLLAFAGLAVVTAVLSWRSLAPDYAMRDETSLVPGAGVEGSCTVSGGVFSLCDVTITYSAAGEVREVDRRYFWVEADSDGDFYDVAVSPDGDHATLQLAEDKLTNRALTSAGFLAICLWMVLVGTRQVRRIVRVRRRYGVEGGIELVPVPAHLHKLVGKSRLNGPTPVFGVEREGRLHKPVQGLSEGEPLSMGEGRFVAIVPAAGDGDPLLLDAELTGLELSDEERAVLLSAAAVS